MSAAPATPTDLPKLGDLIAGKYEVESILGAGGMGMRAMCLLGVTTLASCASDAGDAAANHATERSLPHAGVAAPEQVARVAEDVRAAIDATGSGAVIVELEEPGGPTLQERRTAIAQRQARVLGAVPAGLRLHHRFIDAPMFSATLDEQGLRALQAHPSVRSIGMDPPGHGTLAVSVPAVRALPVHKAYGYKGKGITIAILDTGVDASHPDLAGQVVAQHCFTHGACPPNATNEGTEAPDGTAHGTAVSATAVSSGALGPSGFAPEAKLVVVRVFDGKGDGFVSDWIAGLEWVHQNLSVQPVQVVNMSLGTTRLEDAPCDSKPQTPAYALAAMVVAQLNAAGVTVFASSGNDGSATQTRMPGCTTGVITVGATYSRDSGRQPWKGTYAASFGSDFASCSDAQPSFDMITCFTNSGPRLNLVAPGAVIFTAYPGYDLGPWAGTSMASPAAAGTAALMLQANNGLTPARIASLLASTGHALTDSKNGKSFPRIDVLAAVRAAVCDGAPDGTPCDDGSACTHGDSCHGGSCQGVAEADGTPCDDGSACSQTDACKSGECVGQDMTDCATPDCAFSSECKPETAECITMELDFFDGKPCGGDACNGSCTARKCVASTVLPDGTACPDGACEGGMCVALPPDAGSGASGGSTMPGGCGCSAPASRPQAVGLWATIALLLARRRGIAHRRARLDRDRDRDGG